MTDYWRLYALLAVLILVVVMCVWGWLTGEPARPERYRTARHRPDRGEGTRRLVAPAPWAVGALPRDCSQCGHQFHLRPCNACVCEVLFP